MKIYFTDVSSQPKDVACTILFCKQLENGKVKFETEDNKTFAKLGYPIWTNDKEQDGALDEEGKVRRAISNALKYCLDNKANNVAIDLSEERGELAYFINIASEVAEEFDEQHNAADMTLTVLCDLNSAVQFDKNAANFEIETQSFGSCGDPLESKFIELNNQFKSEPQFRDYLLNLINEKGIGKFSKVYHDAGISKSTFSKIMNYARPHQPSKDTVAALAIGLKLDLAEAQKFYNAAGYYLGMTDFTDKVIRFFISEKIYDIYEVNCCMCHYGRLPLGERMREERYQK